MRASCLPPLLLLSGCGGCQDRSPSPLLRSLDASTPRSIQVVEASGALGVEVPLRLVNDYDVAVPGGDISVQVLGVTAQAPSSVSVDETGYALLPVTGSGPEMFQVLPSGSSDGASGGAGGRAFLLGGRAPGLDLMPASPRDPQDPTERIATLSTGVVAASGPSLVYHPLGHGGLPSHEIASLHDYHTGLRTFHIDNDGILDVAFWSPSEILLLRGRPGGGASWGAGLEAPGLAITGVAGGDVNGDQLTDLAVTVSDGVEASIVFLVGDGAFGFVPDQEFPLDVTPTDIILAHTDRDGLAEAAILDSSGNLLRYAMLKGQWTRAGVNAPQIGANLPCTFVAAVDLNGLGTEDLIVQGGVIAGDSRDLVFFTTENPTMRYDEYFSAFDAAAGDLSGDGMADIVVRIAGEVHFYTAHNTSGTLLVERNATGFPDTGAIAVGDMDDDGCSDVVVADGPLRAFLGNSVCNDGLAPGQIEGQWTVRDDAWESLYLGSSGPFTFADLDGDGEDDAFLVIQGTVSERLLSVYALDSGAASLSSAMSLVGSLPLGPVDPVAPLRVCDGEVFTIVDGATGNQVVRVAMVDGEPTLLTAATAGSLLACGRFEDGGVVAVGHASGSVQILDPDLQEVNVISMASIVALTAGDPDGDGFDEPISCSSQACDILAADLDGDGVDEVVTSERSRVGLESLAGEAPEQLGGGRLSIVDIDGDGLLDVLAFDGEALWLYASVPGGLAPPIGYHTIRTGDDLLTATRLLDDSLVLVGLGTDGALAVTTAR